MSVKSDATLFRFEFQGAKQAGGVDERHVELSAMLT
jgi:hypothetical protein